MFVKPVASLPILVAATLVAGLSLSGLPLSAQSLADVAKKEEERRQKTGEPTKVYTNKDLKAPSGPAGAPPAQTTPAPAADAPKDAAADPKAKDGKASAADKSPVRNQAYWSGSLKTLQTKLDQDESYAEAMQTHINSLTTDFVNRDDPIQKGKLERDRIKALADLADLKKSVEEDKKAIAQLHEDARLAGVPPGWLR